MADNGVVIYITYKNMLLVGNESTFISDFFIKPYKSYIPPKKEIRNRMHRDPQIILYDENLDLLQKYFSYSRNKKSFDAFSREAFSVFSSNIEMYRTELINLLTSYFDVLNKDQQALLTYLQKEKISFGEMIYKNNHFITQYTKYYTCGVNSLIYTIDSNIDLVIVKPLILGIKNSISTVKGSYDKQKDKSFLECARRELCEEIGYSIDAEARLVDTLKSITLDIHTSYPHNNFMSPRIYKRFNWKLTDEEYANILSIIQKQNRQNYGELFNLRFIDPTLPGSEKPFYYDFANGQLDLMAPDPISVPVPKKSIPKEPHVTIISTIKKVMPASTDAVLQTTDHSIWLKKGGFTSNHVLYTKNKDAYKKLN